MRGIVLGLCATTMIAAALAQTALKELPTSFRIAGEANGLATHLRPNIGPSEFQFAIVSDRTGGHRAKVFSRAVEQINLLQPEFVVSVGDLIEGYTKDTDELTRQWREFQGYVAKLEMPFFYTPGNHDVENPIQEKVWTEKFGRRYYQFVYKNVLFLILSTEDPPGEDRGKISAEQIAFVNEALAQNKDVSWTMVFMHKPLWGLVEAEAEKTGLREVEKALAGRPYTVIAGHVHRYEKTIRNGQRYYMLATTGGASKVRGPEYGEVDHIVWVTMKKDGPVLANILLGGILPEDLRKLDSEEESHPTYSRRPAYATRGIVTFRGQPLEGFRVILQTATKETGLPRIDGVTRPDGTFTLSSYQSGDGAPKGTYTVLVQRNRPPFDSAANAKVVAIPVRYTTATTSPITVTIQPGTNDLVIELTE